MKLLGLAGRGLLGVVLVAGMGCANAKRHAQTDAKSQVTIPAAPIALTETLVPEQPSTPVEPLKLSGPMDRPEVRDYIEDLARKHSFDRQQLAVLFSEIKPLPKVVNAISKPAEAQPWHKYRPRFLQPERIAQGVEFWRAHADAFAAAQQWFGVPPEIIIAILGVETRFGANAGNFRVLDSLATLGFDYTPRATFFRKELQEFLLLCREQSWDPRDIKGSYAGAMGLGQFMPSSYRRFAVDFDQDGVRDIRNSATDAIGSIAYYLYAHGWGAGEPVVAQAKVEGDGFSKFLSRDFKIETPVADLRAGGVTIEGEPSVERGGLFTLENTEGLEYWVGFANFYAITRYNRSVLYSMAVYDLAQEVARRQNGLRLTESN